MNGGWGWLLMFRPMWTPRKQLLGEKNHLYPSCSEMAQHARGAIPTGSQDERAPTDPANGQQLPMNDAKWEGLYPSQVYVGLFVCLFLNMLLPPQIKLQNIMQMCFCTCSFRLSKPHHGFRWPNEKNKIKLHLWPLRLKTELKWGCPARRRIGHTRWYNWPIILNVAHMPSRLRDPWEWFLHKTAKR